jgi:hypothetical protein
MDPGVHGISDQNRPSGPELTTAGAFPLEFFLTNTLYLFTNFVQNS